MLEELGKKLSLLEIFDILRPFGVDHIDHWKQGEFHHDFVMRVRERPADLPSDVLVVSTNCNGGVKEVLYLEDVPQRWALWNYRCPDNPEFEGEAPKVCGFTRTYHWFDPCDLLKPGTRSEYKKEWRRRQRGGGWVPLDSNEE